MFVARIFVSCPNPWFSQLILVIVWRSLCALLQMAFFFYSVFPVWFRTRVRRPIQPSWGRVVLRALSAHNSSLYNHYKITTLHYHTVVKLHSWNHKILFFMIFKFQYHLPHMTSSRFRVSILAYFWTSRRIFFCYDR